MDTGSIELSRISKFFIDRDQRTADEALARRRHQGVTLVCGADVGCSYVLQLAVMTAVNLANRCFPGAVRIALDPKLADSPLLVWPTPGVTFEETLTRLEGAAALVGPEGSSADGRVIVFGNATVPTGALRVTFDGWVAKTGPAATVERLPEREYCSLAGVLAAALAVAELFFSFAEISIEASRRPVALSLWRPDLNADDPAALGIPVQFLPSDLWVLGLGHLGNAYLWSIATLPYSNPATAEFFLDDFDRVVIENTDTGMLFTSAHVGQYKTRACAAWLEERGFRTRLVERALDEHFRCQIDEPRLALCGFDSNRARRHLATASFLRVVESGLGGTAQNFDTISMHTWPNPRSAEELWPDIGEADREKEHAHRTQVANENAAYLALGIDECGRFDLAGQSVAVPFVGAAAATLVVAEVLRLLHGGSSYEAFKFGLAAPAGRTSQKGGTYGPQDFGGLKYCQARALRGWARRAASPFLGTPLL
jgi:hypothetical protein